MHQMPWTTEWDISRQTSGLRDRVLATSKALPVPDGSRWYDDHHDHGQIDSHKRIRKCVCLVHLLRCPTRCMGNHLFGLVISRV